MIYRPSSPRDHTHQPHPHMAKKIHITKSHDRPTVSAGSAAIKRFLKSANVSSFPTKPQQSSKDKDDEYEDVGGDDLGMAVMMTTGKMVMLGRV